MLRSSRLYLYRILTCFLPETSGFSLKRALLRWCGANIGCNVRICSSALILGAGELTIGENTWIGQRVTLLATGKLSIGKNVDIGPCVYVGNGTHLLQFDGERCAGIGTSPDVTIGDGCWLGAHVTVLPGIVIGNMTMVAAGGVVTKALPSHCLAAGVPAVVKRQVKIDCDGNDN